MVSNIKELFNYYTNIVNIFCRLDEPDKEIVVLNAGALVINSLSPGI